MKPLVLKALRGFVEPFRAVLNPLPAGLVGERDEEMCSYSSLTHCWTVILGLFRHLRSRNQMDETRNTRTYAQTVFECSEQPYDPDDPELHTACSQTCCSHLARVETEALERGGDGGVAAETVKLFGATAKPTPPQTIGISGEQDT